MAVVQGDGQVVHLKGQVALDVHGHVVGPRDMRAQGRKTLENIRDVHRSESVWCIRRRPGGNQVPPVTIRQNPAMKGALGIAGQIDDIRLFTTHQLEASDLKLVDRLGIAEQ